jgi:hypothetical protein
MQANSPASIANVVASLDKICGWNYAGDGGGGQAVTVAELVIGQIGPGPDQIPIAAAEIAPAATLTASATVYATVTVNKRTNAAPGTAVPIAVFVTNTTANGGTGNWTAWKQVPATTLDTGAGSFVSPGDVITVATTKASTGTILPQFQLALFTGTN